MKLIERIDELAKESSRKKKEELLKALHVEHGEQLIENIFILTYSPYMVFGIKQLPEFTPKQVQDGFDINTISILKEVVESWKSGNPERKKEALRQLSDHLSELDPEDVELVRRIIDKDLRCGISVKTINKVMGKIVPEWPVMLCHSFTKGNCVIPFPAIVQEKLDGMRVNVMIRDGHVSFFGRSGKPILLSHGCVLHEVLKRLPACGHDNIILDGELLVATDMTYHKVMPRKTGNGILNRAIRGTITEDESDLVMIKLWDVIRMEAFEQGVEDRIPYEERFDCVEEIVRILDSRLVHLPKTRIVQNLQDAFQFYKDIVSSGGEGAILKAKDAFWVPKRVSTQLKLKIENEVDLRIIDMKEGTGKHEGRLGALICTTDDEQLQVSVGSGFNDKQRKQLWEKKQEFIGKIVTVKANDILTRKTDDVMSLFLPIFVEVREDKDETNTVEEIQGMFDGMEDHKYQ